MGIGLLLRASNLQALIWISVNYRFVSIVSKLFRVITANYN